MKENNMTEEESLDKVARLLKRTMKYEQFRPIIHEMNCDPSILTDQAWQEEVNELLKAHHWAWEEFQRAYYQDKTQRAYNNLQRQFQAIYHRAPKGEQDE
jgi:hypothetical protein